MTVVVVGACKGSPGATSVAARLSVELARRSGRLYPAARLIEMDPDGGDLAGSMGLDPLPGLATLGQLGRHGLTPTTLTIHAQRSSLAPGVAVVAGISGPVQRAALARLARRVAGAVRNDEIDTVVDVGRTAVEGPLPPLLEAADEFLLVCRDTTSSLVHARSSVIALGEMGRKARIVVVGRVGDHPDELATALGREVAAVVAPSYRRDCLAPPDRVTPVTRTGRASGLEPDVTIEHLAGVVLGERPAAGSPEEPIVAAAPATVVEAAIRTAPARGPATRRVTR